MDWSLVPPAELPPLGAIAPPTPPDVLLPDWPLLLFRFPPVVLVPLLLGVVLLFIELGVLLPLLKLELFWSYEPPRFSLEAQPTASNPAIAVNAISFFISTPFVSHQLPLSANRLNQAFTHESPKRSPQTDSTSFKSAFFDFKL